MNEADRVPQERSDLFKGMTASDIRSKLVVALLFDRPLHLVWDKIKVGDIFFKKGFDDRFLIVDNLDVARGAAWFVTYPIEHFRHVIYHTMIAIGKGEDSGLIAGSEHLLSEVPHG